MAFVELLKRGFKVFQPPGERFELFDNLRSGYRIILLEFDDLDEAIASHKQLLEFPADIAKEVLAR